MLSALGEQSDRLFTLGDVTYTTKPSYPHRRAGNSGPVVRGPHFLAQLGYPDDQSKRTVI